MQVGAAFKIAERWKTHDETQKQHTEINASKKETNGELEKLSANTAFKEVFSDSNNIILLHELEDVNKKSLFPKFQLI